jgi:hypothetical protein
MDTRLKESDRLHDIYVVGNARRKSGVTRDKCLAQVIVLFGCIVWALCVSMIEAGYVLSSLSILFVSVASLILVCKGLPC